MTGNNIPESKEDILKGLIISEEDTRAQLKELVTKIRKLLSIEDKTNKIVLSPKFPFSNYEKIILHLIGKYFAKELNLINESRLRSREISDDLGIKATTLSSPLGKACSDGLVNKEDDFYSITHYRIRDAVDSIILKYASEKTKPETRAARKPAKRVARKKEKEQPEPEEITLTANPKGLEDLAKDIGIEQERLQRLFEFEEEEIHILEALKGTTESKRQFNTALAVLTTRYYYFREQEIESSKLSRIIEDLGIGAIGHLHRNLSRDRKFLIPKKKNRRTDTYRITTPGVVRGVLLLKEYFSE
jgi:hypothetical protein